ncbi:tRNA (Guanine37-N(1)-) methyltransferase [Frankia casuarinae]|uniref:tRNA (guanine-N(1)-)-methyltransferase n=1 Tax=Frankia casuarinae (strain DSM 45818 / CECT 9043 / HFP020203 / CcI3) TaxID=106370 RepID=TRMD_FRACC|nr:MULTISPECIES: tRNA (guanosine(37)-N1)-methyltransferase TrmD [Frankia]Q2J6Z9.1 RecName: Full=tRNA (guanine-N(1)-)-methyltransferase; AltName: Full=M1G-methyltransferase; AltName: Full=tRNA [GM37] methyltransferase [Frankia casuarinae]ABD12943.1 tRNA (Guanine37-N(1)-) methyltransferase [Frankia casuarinae]ETA03546.1 tRNA (Guanine37-N(1)-) methyltransferase [Frankia sp. CcI6]EYT93503.1 tRNA (Guanine37-N(1)-) methyltransferase [Frankia casuarinae]KDA43734.1 tRNA (Guanine37-N(1)-) methyltransfe
MRADIVTIFPAYLEPLRLSLVGRAQEHGTLQIHTHDLRMWTTDVHRTVDDAPYGGGPGMVMRPEPWDAALSQITARVADSRPRVVVPTPAGTPFTQRHAEELAREPWLVFCCGRYEGIDARVIETWADDEISIGDYVLAGGEAATLVILEAVTRLLPGVLGNSASVADDSFSDGLLEGPVYTRPPVWRGTEVPPVLRSGDHEAIARWRRSQALRRTLLRRPDLLEHREFAEADRVVLAAAAAEAAGRMLPAPTEGTGLIHHRDVEGPGEG